MNKRRIIAILIAFVLTIAATAMWSASTDEREGDPDAIVLEDSGSEAGERRSAKKEGRKQSRQSSGSAIQGFRKAVRSEATTRTRSIA